MNATSAIVFITGFREDPLEFTGLEKVWRDARQFSSPDSWVIKPFVWNADWKAEAAQIARCLAPGARVVVCAYSWGAGFGCMELARQLGKHEIGIEWACLADPVYRSRSFFMRWMALTKFARIKAPPNIMHVSWVRQRVNRPAGHDLVGSGETKIETATEVNLGHGQIDNSTIFADKCMKAIRAVAG